MSIYDWELIKKAYPQAKWAATDYRGEINVFDKKPLVNTLNDQWYCSPDNEFVRYVGFARDESGKITDKVGYWRSSLEECPDEYNRLYDSSDTCSTSNTRPKDDVILSILSDILKIIAAMYEVEK